MAKSSDAAATKPGSNSPYQLDPKQALRAAKALTAHIKSSESTKAAESTKKNLLEDDASDDGDAATDGPVPVWLLVTTKKHIVDKKRLKPAKIALPHPLPAPGQRICLM